MSVRDRNSSSNNNPNPNHEGENDNEPASKAKLIALIVVIAFLLGSFIASGVTFVLLKGNHLASKPSSEPLTPSSSLSPPQPSAPLTPSPTPSPQPPLPVTPLPELPNNRDFSSNNTDFLKETRVFNDRINFNEQEKPYSFSLDKSSNISIYLDKVTNEVGLELYVDPNENSLLTGNQPLMRDRASISRSGLISKVLGAGKYRVVVTFKKDSSDYTLQLVNNTNDAVNVGTIKGTKTFSDSITPNNRLKYYKFGLDSPSKVNFYLDNVTSEVNIALYVDKNEDGVITSSSERLNGDIASSSSPGKISQTLGAGNYFVVISRKDNNTSYTLTLVSP